ncbi:hypothetical protein GCM10011332_31210 [Terasakiella brassicae]|uniref:Tetratricopeptide repeat protein n=1 Tax=Terasakiella brassicae TaxID=1634917 RepID=A0A917FE70_9PROT|nr:tetratricopeptide repeat protein [Terasakiella brassicae]GGF74927.1 hypothetical protein GCM10011332_31210 [Terasakiella brassicae]
MYALISGQAAKAAFAYGDNYKVISADTSDHCYETSLANANYVFSGASDINQIEVSSEEEGLCYLKNAVEADRALILILMLLDPEEDTEIKKETAEILNDFLEDEHTRTFVSNQLFSAPSSDLTDINAAKKLSTEHKKLLTWLIELDNCQEAIKKIRTTWDFLSSSLFKNSEDKDLAESILIDRGAFYQISTALNKNDSRLFNSAKFWIFATPELQKINNYRKILSEWLTPLSEELSNPIPKPVIRPESEKRKKKTKLSKPKNISNHKMFERVNSQIEEIKRLLRMKDTNKARRYANELSKAQIQNDNKDLAPISLCNIASYSLDVFQPSFSLEMLKKAIQINNQDGWCWGQLADAYIHLERYDDAENALEEAVKWGAAHFGLNGLARIYRHKGLLSDAKETFEKAILEFADNQDVWNSFCGLGEVLHELGEHNKAISLLNDTIEKYPSQSKAHTSLGHILKDLGQFEEAIQIFKNAIQNIEPTAIAYVGLIHSYKEIGDLDKALETAKEFKSSFSIESSAWREYGDCLLLKKKYSHALKTYSQMIEEHPYDYTGIRGKADTYWSMGKLDLAEKAFDEGIKSFDNTVSLQLKRANLYKETGKLELSLKSFSEIVNSYPTVVSAKFGQAEAFKKLGYFDKAIEIYKTIDDERASHYKNTSIAAIYVAQGNYADALKTIQPGEPKTKSDWVAEHIRGMALLKSKKIKDAVELFESAISKIPFKDQKAYFQSALIVAKLRNRDLDDIINYLPKEQNDVTNIIKLHVYGYLNENSLAQEVYNSLQAHCVEYMMPLRDELGAQLKLNDNRTKHDREWLFEQECNVIALGITSIAA